MERMDCKAEFFLTNFLADFTNKNPIRIFKEISSLEISGFLWHGSIT